MFRGLSYGMSGPMAHSPNSTAPVYKWLDSWEVWRKQAFKWYGVQESFENVSRKESFTKDTRTFTFPYVIVTKNTFFLH